MANPMKTRTQPDHWMSDNGLPNMNTEARMVKNFRVVVMIEQVNGPNEVMVVKLKCFQVHRSRMVLVLLRYFD